MIYFLFIPLFYFECSIEKDRQRQYEKKSGDHTAHKAHKYLNCFLSFPNFSYSETLEQYENFCYELRKLRPIEFNSFRQFRVNY